MASKHEEVMADGIVARLATVEGGTYGASETPGRVCRVIAFEDAMLDSSITAPQVYVRVGEERRRFGPDSCDVTADLEVFVMVARTFSEPSELPSGGRSDEWGKAQAELTADYADAILSDTTFGVPNARLVDDTIVTDYDDRWIQGWVNVEIRFVVRYRYNRRPPATTDFR